MKKGKLLLITVICLLMTGCSNHQTAEQAYNSTEKIAENTDWYQKVSYVGKSTDDGMSISIGEFDGTETIWKKTLENKKDVEIDFSFTLTEGQAKIVHIDADGNVTTIIESASESLTDEVVTKTVSLTDGENRFKIVGYDCRNVELEMIFTESK